MLTQGELTNSSASEVTPLSQAEPQVPLLLANSVPTGMSDETTPRGQAVSPVANTAGLNCYPEETPLSPAGPPLFKIINLPRLLENAMIQTLH